jgi:flagellar protein FliS
MSYGKTFHQYERSDIETAGQLDLIIICYQKVILCLKQSKDHIKEKEFDKKANKIMTALNIINELHSSLNFDEGGQIAKSLDSLYTYLTNRIILADVRKNLSIFDECINILNELKSGWEGIKPEEEETAPLNNKTDQIPRLSHQIAV